MEFLIFTNFFNIGLQWRINENLRMGSTNLKNLSFLGLYFELPRRSETRNKKYVLYQKNIMHQLNIKYLNNC